MILVLDACTIANLLNVFQGGEYFDLLESNFSKVHITREVIDELRGKKSQFLWLFEDDRDTLENTYSEKRFQNLISEFDNDKSQCIKFVTRFSESKRLLTKTNGEYYSALLSLYISRWGEKDFNENTNQVLFATDDAKAERIYLNLFDANQIGKIIDSIDLMVILHLKRQISRETVIRYIQGLIPLYSREINEVIVQAVAAKKRDTNSKNQLALTSLIENLSEEGTSAIANLQENKIYKVLFQSHPKLKKAIKAVPLSNRDSKLSYIIGRQREIENSLVWSIEG